MIDRRSQIRLFAKPLVSSEKSLCLKGMRIYYRKIHHFARFITIDRSGGPGRVVSWGAQYLFSPFHMLSLGFGQYLNDGMLTYLDAPGAGDRFAQDVRRDALPILESLVTLEDFFRFVTTGDAAGGSVPKSRHNIIDFPISYIPLLVGTGRFRQAREMCRELPQNRWFNDKYMGPIFRQYLDQLYPLLMEDNVPALASILHSWEEKTVRANGIGHLWERTPFPFETEKPLDT